MSQLWKHIQYVFSSQHHCRCRSQFHYHFPPFNRLQTYNSYHPSVLKSASHYILVHNLFPCFSWPNSLSDSLSLRNNTSQLNHHVKHVRTVAMYFFVPVPCIIPNCCLNSTQDNASLNFTPYSHFCPDFDVSWIYPVGLSAATNLEVHKGDRDLFDYCTFGMETDCLGKHSLRNRSQPEESIKTDTQSIITKYVTNRFRSLKKPLMLFISSRRTSCSRC